MSDNIDKQFYDAFWTHPDREKALSILSSLPDPTVIRNKYSYLRGAAGYGWLDVVIKLITQYNCDPYSETSGGLTVLHWACINDHTDVVKYLTSTFCLDPLKENELGDTPLYYCRGTETEKYLSNIIDNAKKQGFKNVVEYLKHCKKEDDTAVAEAMKEGGGDLIQSNIVLHGPPGAGKTSVKRLIIGLPPLPKEKQTATDIMENAVRAVSTSQMKQFEVIENDELIAMLAKEVDDHRTKKGEEHFDHKLANIDAHPIAMAPITSSRDKSDNLSTTVPSSRTSTKATSIQSIRSSLSRASGSVRLFDSRWHHVVDSGGQPQFQDILPLVYRSPSLNIVVVRLTDELDTKPKMCFYEGGRNVYTLPDRLVLSNRDFIIRMCQTAAAQATPGGVVPCVMVISTHKDMLGNNSEDKIREWNQGLASLREEFRSVLICKSDEEIIFTVNTMVEGDERQKYTKELQEWITAATKQYASPVHVPLRWFAYQLDLDKGEGVVRMADCYKSGEALGMSEVDVQNALRFLNQTALVLYFPDDIPELVLTKMDPLIGRLSNLVKASFIKPKYCLPTQTEAIKRLSTKGLFRKSFLAIAFQDIKVCDLNDEEFLKLLECLKIAVKVGEEEYFLPSALSLEPYPEDSSFRMCSVPLAFFWGERILPHGFFFTVAVELLGKPSGKDGYEFELRTDIAQWRGEIQVSEAKRKIPGVVKLTDRKTWIQVSYSSDSHYCSKVYRAVERATHQAVTRFQHIRLGSRMTGYLCPLCPLCEMNDHYCYLSDDKRFLTCSLNDSKTGPSTPDMLCWTEGLAENKSGTSYVSRGSPGVADKVTVPSSTTVHTSVLSSNKSDLPTITAHSACAAHAGTRPRYAPELRDVHRLLRPMAYEWQKIGRDLGVDFGYREGLVRKGEMKTDEDKLEAVLNKWIQSHCSEVSWDNLIQVLKDLGFIRTAKDVKNYLQTDPEAIRKYSWNSSV